MKIEIGESVMLSWLRHVKACQIVQLNWKPSPTWPRPGDGIADVMLARAIDFFGDSTFKKTKGAAQLMRQAEIDALGIHSREGSIERVIAVDTVFHKAGLNYGSTEETVSRVTKKVIRSALTMHGYFPEIPHEIVFAAPMIHRATLVPIEAAFVRISEFGRQEGLQASFCLIANEEYRTEIVEPLREVARSIADTAELFLRSLQLLDLCGSSQPGRRSVQAMSADSSGANGIAITADAVAPIGQFVRTSLANLLLASALPAEVMAKLQEAEYCKSTFDMNYPILIQCRDAGEAERKRLVNGRARYWSGLVGDGFLLCNDWYKRNRGRYVSWLQQFPGND